MKISTFSIMSGAVALIVSLSAPVLADPPPWAGGKGHGKGGKQEMHGGKTVVQGPNGNCRVSYKYGRHGYEEKWKCTGPGHFQPGPPPWAPAHGYRKKHGGGGYAFPAGLMDGRSAPACSTARPWAAWSAPRPAASRVAVRQGERQARGDRARHARRLRDRPGGRRNLTRVEETCFSQTFEHVPDRETIVWNNQQQGAQYQVQPLRTAETDNGLYCREYQAKATVGGKVSSTYGTACRQPDGSWKLMN